MSLEHITSTEKIPTNEPLSPYPKDPSRFIVKESVNMEKRKEEKQKIKNLLRYFSLSKKLQSEHLNGREAVPIIVDKDNAMPIAKKSSLASDAADFIPVIGSLKMISESLHGKQYGSDTPITGKVRLVHGVSGVGFLIADMTGIGIIASSFGKAVVKIGVRTLEKKLANEIIKKEARVLAERGLERHNKEVEIKQQIA